MRNQLASPTKTAPLTRYIKPAATTSVNFLRAAQARTQPRDASQTRTALLTHYIKPAARIPVNIFLAALAAQDQAHRLRLFQLQLPLHQVHLLPPRRSSFKRHQKDVTYIVLTLVAKMESAA